MEAMEDGEPPSKRSRGSSPGSNTVLSSTSAGNSTARSLSSKGDSETVDSKALIPSQTLQVLRGHKDEVWFLQFSHNGKYLASSSKDESAIIWEVKDHGELSFKHALIGHKRPVLSISWSPDDKQILTCGMDEALKRWDVNSGQCLNVYERPGVRIMSCGWLRDGKQIVAGLENKSICLWKLDGAENGSWTCQQQTANFFEMAISTDEKETIITCTDFQILLLDREANVWRPAFEELHVINSFSLSEDNKFLLVNLMNQEIHLWNIEKKPYIVATFKGHKLSRFIIRSCFGGLQQTFVASGSEDSQVYIYHRATGKLLGTLSGHSGAVNCVSWNPSFPHMLASASDDHTIRIYGV